MDIFCVKCRKKVQPTSVSAGPITFTRKRSGAQGSRFSLQAVCPICGINMKRFIKESDVAKYNQPAQVEAKPIETAQKEKKPETVL
jgi:hypothetical protein